MVMQRIANFQHFPQVHQTSLIKFPVGLAAATKPASATVAASYSLV